MGDLSLTQALANLALAFAQLVGLLLAYASHWLLLIVWVAWWLGAVNWKRCWEYLGRGGWAPLVLLMLMTALVWSRLEPTTCECLAPISIPNFWWQLGYVSLFVASAFFCGYLQGLWHWTPREIDLDPPVHGFEHVQDESLHHPGRDETPQAH